MSFYKNITKADYLQRTRSYVFLITLIASVLMAYSFIPGENSEYSTVRIGSFIGKNNAAWIGHVTAIMASTFLWIIGFYIINNGVKRDKETGVGQIIATTSISNFSYLLSKVLSNFMVLITLVAIIILVGFGIYIFIGEANSFSVSQFFLPYIVSTIPSIFLLSVIAIVFEIIFGNKTNFMNVAFFFLFGAVIAITNAGNSVNLQYIDPLGIKFLTNQMSNSVNQLHPNISNSVNVGFLFNGKNNKNYFDFQGSDWSILFIFSRIVWIAIAFGLLYATSKIFNRFDSKIVILSKNKNTDFVQNEIKTEPKAIQLSGLPKTNPNFGIFPIIKTEFLMLIRKGPKWFWLVNFGGMLAMVLMPINQAHQIVLPVLWFLQINRWADLVTKEKFFGTSNFIYSSFKPLQRLLTSQIIAGFLLATFLALPLIFRNLINGNLIEIVSILLGSLLLISFAIFSGIISGGKKIFEILFFVITYTILSGGTFLNYFGGIHQNLNYFLILVMLLFTFLVTSFLIRKHEIKNQ